MIDYIHVRQNGAVISRQYLADSSVTAADHTDFIQCVPSEPYCERSQYALAQLSGIQITDCALYSSTSLHGITGFDGLFSNICVDNVVINTQSMHKVTFNGLLSGSFTRLHTHPPKPLRLLANNARVGGVPTCQGKLYYCNILHFADALLAYQPLQADDTVQVVDNRGMVGSRSGTGTVVLNLVNFDITKFRTLVSDKSFKGLGVNEQCLAYQECAKICGDIYE